MGNGHSLAGPVVANKRIRKKRRKRAELSTFETRLLESLRQAVAIARGELAPSRVTVFERMPDGSVERRVYSGAEWLARERGGAT